MTFVIARALCETMTAKRVKEIMDSLGMDRVQFARAVGASPRTVDGWLSKRAPSKITARLLEGMARKSA